MDLQLGGKICLVTGASRGIGRGAAKVLAAEGCRVAIVARRENLLEELADEIEREAGARPLVVAEDSWPTARPSACARTCSRSSAGSTSS